MGDSYHTFPIVPAKDLLRTPLQYVRGVGPVRAGLLARLNLLTLQDLLFHFPVAHKDRATITPIARLQVGADANIVAQIVDLRARSYGGKHKIEVLLQDQSGEIRAVWWNPYVAEKLTPNGWGFFSGKTVFAGERREFANAEFEILENDDEAPPLPRGERGRGEGVAGDVSAPSSGAELTCARRTLAPPSPHGGEGTPPPAPSRKGRGENPSLGRIVPVYNLRPKQRLESGEEAPEIRLNQNFLRKLAWQALEAGAAEQLEEQLPAALRGKMKLLPLAQAIREIHFPPTFAVAALARRRLVFEELFIIALGVALRRAQIERLPAPKPMPLTPAIQKRIAARLPFTLTPSQQTAFQEIAADLAAARPMNRLLQGDVGSGKTAVAVASLLLCVAHGAQTALLAPTEVLAEQHARTLTNMLKDSRVNIALLRGGLAGAARQEFLAQLAAGGIHIAVGTHALLEDDVIFKHLGLIVVDEQHKFGVAQRLALRGKGRAPHVLVMTATPIPRTLTLTLYGDLDVSVISEPPPGRAEIVTRCLKETERERAYELIRAEARGGHATYIVLPRIESDGDSPLPLREGVRGRGRAASKLWSEVKGVEAEAKRLRAHLSDLRIGMLHGRMASDEKESVLAKLREGQLDVLVSTQVIEVGIDLPQATVMVIENAEMFGLAALHQLRGRVGRSARKSYCLAFANPATDEAVERLKTFSGTRNGFEIAEADFRLRGPGQFFGTQQSGLPELKIADLVRDVATLSEARREAFVLVAQDAALSQADHAGLKRRVREVLGKRLGLVDVG